MNYQGWRERERGICRSSPHQRVLHIVQDQTLVMVEDSRSHLITRVVQRLTIFTASLGIDPMNEFKILHDRFYEV